MRRPYTSILTHAKKGRQEISNDHKIANFVYLQAVTMIDPVMG